MTNNVKDAISKAKAALDKIKIKKEKTGEGKDARETSKMEMNQEEFDGALGEARTALDTFTAEQQRQTPTPVDVSNVKYSIDKIALVRGNADHVEAAVKDAKEKLDAFDKEQQQAQKHEQQQQRNNK